MNHYGPVDTQPFCHGVHTSETPDTKPCVCLFLIIHPAYVFPAHTSGGTISIYCMFAVSSTVAATQIRRCVLVFLKGCLFFIYYSLPECF